MAQASPFVQARPSLLSSPVRGPLQKREGDMPKALTLLESKQVCQTSEKKVVLSCFETMLRVFTMIIQ